MITLFLDTSTSKLIVGIYKDDTCINKVVQDSLKDMSSAALKHINDVLEASNVKIEQINRIMVVNGPGSFTGIRAGVTIAKTLAWARGIEIVTVSELELLNTTDVKTPYTVCLIDARRDCYYAAIYKKKKVALEEQYISKENLFKEIENLGELKKFTFVSYDDIDIPHIEPELNIEKLFEKKFENLNPHSVNPNYLKRVEAEEKLDAERNRKSQNNK